MKNINRNPKLIFRILISPSFQGVNKLFVLSFENENGRTERKCYCLPNVELKDYNINIDGRNFFDQLAENNINI